jgi:ribonucleotide monophosphatase NagD (HAD superfamily)
MAKPLTLEALLSFDTYIFDCDGVIWGISESDTRLSVRTINFLLARDKRVMFITNNSNKTRAKFVQELESKGVDFGVRTADQKLTMMISAAFTTANYLKEHQLRRPFVITSDIGVLDELRLAGIDSYYATVDDAGAVRPEFESAAMKGVAPEISDIIGALARPTQCTHSHCFCCTLRTLMALHESAAGAHADVDCIVVGWDLALTARKVGVAINYIKWHEDLHGDEAGYAPLPIVACSGDAGSTTMRAFPPRRCPVRISAAQLDHKIAPCCVQASWVRQSTRLSVSRRSSRRNEPFCSSCCFCALLLRPAAARCFCALLLRAAAAHRCCFARTQPAAVLLASS